MLTQARMTDAQAAQAFIFGGKAILTLRSAQTGAHYTYKIREGKKKNPNDPKEIPVYFVDLLKGPDNLSDYTYVGTIFGKKEFKLTSKSRITKDAPSFIAFDFSFRCIMGGKIPGSLEIWHEGRCGRCGRRLTVPESIATGFGPECAEMGQVELPVVPAPAYNVERFEHLKKFRDRNDNAGDAKFLALSQEAGITIEDWQWFSEQEKAMKSRGFYQPQQSELLSSFKRNLSKATKPKPEINGEALASSIMTRRQASVEEIEAAVAEYRDNNPEAYYQDGMFTPEEAHAVAFNKFKHELETK